ncbi:O-antigen ligase family protein [Uliginosibacterium sp. 31-16]|uniref:O-antigen ligase family protein n=1 Tax=Uliginosibacterium sp. 31-16 TaxID=3068315 RepID=UPI00273E4519|nr:O-antigen ligase family protein [Uliginosibacterium sp. 31-16]MDP5238430.1 O-antigen ligase family protein [Uliginosibacterium sp. 31-16]
MSSLQSFLSALSASERRLLLGAALLEAALMFVWSVTGTIALRHGLLLLLISMLPFIRLDLPALRREFGHGAILLLGMLTLWIVLHNLFFAWDAGRAWYESVQWFKAMLCLLLGLALVCAPRSARPAARWRFWLLGVAAAWALHLILNVLLKDWSQPLVTVMQAATRVGSRDMVSYLGTGLLALLLADGVARFAGGVRLLPLATRWLWVSVLACIALTVATMTRNALPVMAVEVGLAIVALIGASATRRQRLRRGALATLVLALVAGAMAANLALDQRWTNFADSARIAWDTEHNTWWIDQVKNPRPVNAQGVPVDHSAYNRIAWIKGVCSMIAEYPLGTGYDRNAFRRALMKHYGADNTATGHAHAGLFDFTMATGIPGGVMFIGALLWLSLHGWRRWRATRDPAGLALAIFTLSYLLRAAVDGIVRDHMLEQAMFVIGLLCAASMADHQESKA